jgi:hypothetical protein
MQKIAQRSPIVMKPKRIFRDAKGSIFHLEGVRTTNDQAWANIGECTLSTIL